MANDKNYTIKLGFIATGFKEATEGVDRINQSLKGTAASVSNFSDKVDAQTGKVIRSVTIQQEKFKGLQDTINKLVIKDLGNMPDITLSLIEKTKNEANIFKQLQEEKAKAFKNAVELEKIAATQGSESLVYLKKKEAIEIEKIEKEKQEKIASLQNKYLSGSINLGAVKGGLSFIETSAANKIATAQQPVIQKTNSIAIAQEESNQLKRIQQTELAQLNAFIEEKKVIRVNGENSIQAKVAEIARRELVVRQNLMEELKTIQANTAATLDDRKILQSSAIEKAKTQLQDLAKELPKAGNQVNTLGDHFSRLAKHVAEVYIAWGIMNRVSSLFSQAVSSIIPVGIALDSVKASLESTIGSSAGAGSAIKAIGVEAQRTGLEIGNLRKNFASFQASTSLAGASLEDTWKMFTNINTVSTALHKTTDETNHIFLALAQIFNKSKVQSEELVKQLGNLLPGAFASFAASMGIQTEELTRRMKEGSVKARDTMLEFTNFMADRFGASFAIASQMLNADINRMQTSFTLLGEAIYKDVNSPLQDLVKSITAVNNYFIDAINGVNSFGTILKDTLGVGFSVVAGILVSKLIPAIQLFVRETVLAKTATLTWASSFAFLKTNWIGIAITAIGTAMTFTKTKTEEFTDAFKDTLDIIKEFEKKRQSLELANKPIEIQVAESDTIKHIDDVLKKYNEMQKNLEKVKGFQGKGFKNFLNSKDFENDVQEYLLAGKGIINFDKISYEDRLKLLEAFNLSAHDLRKKAIEQEIMDKKEQMEKELKMQIEGLPKPSESVESIHAKYLESSGSEVEAKLYEVNAKNSKILNEQFNIVKSTYEFMIEKAESLSAAQLEELGNNIEVSLKAINEGFLVAQNEADKILQDQNKKSLEVSRKQFELNKEESLKQNKSLMQKELDALKAEQEALKSETLLPEVAAQKALEIEQKKYDVQVKYFELNKQITSQFKEHLSLRMKELDAVNQMDLESIYAAIAGGESGGKAGAKNRYSSASSSMQITKGTYESTAASHPELGAITNFWKSSEEEKVKVAKKHYDDLLVVFKDKISALFAYYQGEGKARDFYKKAGVKVGSTEPEDLAKVSQQFSTLGPNSGEVPNASWDKYLDRFLKYAKIDSSFSKEKRDLLKNQTEELEQQNNIETALNELNAKKSVIAKQNLVNLQEYKTLLFEINQKTLEAEGKMEEAAAARFDKEWEVKLDKINKFAAQGDQGAIRAQEQLKLLKEQVVVAAQIEQINKRVSVAQTALRDKEIRLDLDLKGGLIDQFTYQEKIFAIRQETLKLLQEELSKEDALKLTAAQRLQLEKQKKEVRAIDTDKIGSAQSVLNRGNTSDFANTITQFRADSANLSQEKIQNYNKAESDYVIAAAGQTTETQWQLHEDMLEKKYQADQKYALASTKSYTDMFTGIFSSGANTFQALTDMNVKMYGAGSKEAQKSFKMWKQMKTAEIISSTASAAINAFSAMAAIPYVGPVLGAVAAAAAIAYGAIQLQQVNSQQLPAAHGGLTNVPKEQTYLLDKGERVLSPGQNKDFTKFIQNNNTTNTTDSSTPPIVNVKINNQIDKSVTLEHLRTPEGEQEILNIVRRAA